jgi:hypothetical protein
VRQSSDLDGQTTYENEKCKKEIIEIAALSIFSSFHSGCWPVVVLGDGRCRRRKIREHYAGKEVKPRRFIIRNDSLELYCATTGADTLPPLLLIPWRSRRLYSGVGILDDSDLQKKISHHRSGSAGVIIIQVQGKKESRDFY